MAKKATKKKEENILNLESILFNCRDYLRGSASLNEKRDVILTLVFLRFIGEKFDDAQAEMRQQCIDHGITDEEKLRGSSILHPVIRILCMYRKRHAGLC